MAVDPLVASFQDDANRLRAELDAARKAYARLARGYDDALRTVAERDAILAAVRVIANTKPGATGRALRAALDRHTEAAT